MFQTAGARVRLSGSLFSTRPSKPRTHQCMHMSVSLRWTPIIMERFDFLSIYFFLMAYYWSSTKRQLSSFANYAHHRSQVAMEANADYSGLTDVPMHSQATLNGLNMLIFKWHSPREQNSPRVFFFFIQITQRYVHIRVYLQRRMQNRLSCCHEQYSASQALQRQ